MVRSWKLSLSKQQKEDLHAKNDRKCHWCENSVPGRFLNFTHKIPRVIGGSNGVSNRVVTCEKCKQTRSESFTEMFADFTRTVANVDENLIRGAVVRCFHNPLHISVSHLRKTIKVHRTNPGEIYKHELPILKEERKKELEMEKSLKNLQRKFGNSR
jgi:hypothetical protein